MNIKKTEIIGREIKIINSKNETLIGIKGKIINETKNTLTIKTDEKTKKLIKEQITFTINDTIIKGKEITYRPEDRIKRI